MTADVRLSGETEDYAGPAVTSKKILRQLTTEKTSQ